jgi:transcriptional regulator with XRE-family HTH domain
MYTADMFWDTVKEQIKFYDMTQEVFARKAGINYGTFHNWMAKGVLPRANDAVRIAQALNTSVEYLVTGRNPRTVTFAAEIDSHIQHIQLELAAITRAAKKQW